MIRKEERNMFHSVTALREFREQYFYSYI